MQPVVLITGAAGGLGRALAQRFHQGNWRVVVTDQNAAGLAQLGHEMPLAGSITADLRTADACRDVVERTLGRVGRLDAVAAELRRVLRGEAEMPHRRDAGGDDRADRGDALGRPFDLHGVAPRLLEEPHGVPHCVLGGDLERAEGHVADDEALADDAALGHYQMELLICPFDFTKMSTKARS